MNISIRELLQKDVPQCRELLSNVFSSDVLAVFAKDSSDCLHGNTNIKPQFLVATAGDTIVGMVTLTEASFDFDTGQISWLAIDPDHQRQGIGSTLVTSAEEKIAQNGWAKIILASEPERVSFFENLGYAVLEKIDEESTWMRKKLS
jgi:predicted N-acetyltransferase YhbS